MFRSFIYSHSGIERENSVKIRPGGQKHTEAKHYGDDESIPMDVSCTSYKSCNATGVLNFNYTYSLGEALQIIAFANRPGLLFYFPIDYRHRLSHDILTAIHR